MIKDNISQCRLIEPKEGANYLRQKHSVIRPHICLKEYVRTEVSLDKKKKDDKINHIAKGSLWEKYIFIVGVVIF